MIVDNCNRNSRDITHLPGPCNILGQVAALTMSTKLSRIFHGINRNKSDLRVCSAQPGMPSRRRLTPAANRDFTPNLSSRPFLRFQLERAPDRLNAVLHALEAQFVRRRSLRLADPW